MKNLFKEAHKLTMEIVKKYNDVDYKFQFSLCLSYLQEKENREIMKEILSEGNTKTLHSFIVECKKFLEDK